MLARRARLHHGTKKQIYRWLNYLATQLQQQQQTLFAVEYLQPEWLPKGSRNWYRWILTVVYGLTFGLVFGPVFGIGFGIVYGFVYMTVSRLVFGVIFGLVVGLVGGLAGGLTFGVAFKQQTIQPAEASVWSWAVSKKGLLVGLVGGLAVGLVGGLVGGVVAGPVGGITVALIAALLLGLVGGLVGGLSPTQLSERMALSPNEGIWRSGKRGLLFVLLFILFIGLAAGLIVAIFGRSIVDLVYGPIFGVVFGAPGGLILGLTFDLVGGRTGIMAFLQHFVLRFCLWRLKLLPWNLVPFLDEATERLLLRKVGGNYIFVHRLLRDALAIPDEEI